jgi:chaperonin cofactor prefoldin
MSSEDLFRENQELKKAINDVERQIQFLSYEKRKLGQKLDDNKKALFKVCEHTWEMEPPQYQERTSWYCKKCGNYN